MERPWIRRQAFCLAVSLCLLLSPMASFADLAAGVAWLEAQQLSTGEFYSAGTSSTPFQATAEVLETLSPTASLSPDAQARALAFLQGQFAENSEYAARYALAVRATGADASALALNLLSGRNPDGGIGDAAGNDSAALNSAFALRATSAAGLPTTDDVGYAVGYLLAEQRQSGGWADGPNDASVYMTALASMALQRYRFQYSVGTHTSAASEYLFSAQQPAGGWADTVETALALLALIPFTTDSTRYAAALQRLGDAQFANGSWANDVFATALALRALALAKAAPAPVDPSTGGLTGRVVDHSSGASLAGVTVSLDGPSVRQLESGADGRFAVADLDPGTYTATYVIDGYAGASQSLGLSVGQQLDLGTVRLSLLPNTALVTGIVSTAETGAPIAGATVTANGATVSTDAGGGYALTVDPGDLTLAVQAEGYAPVAASGSLVAGAKTIFSVSLYPLGNEHPPAATSLTGTVVDGISGTPLEGVRVAIAGTTSEASTGGDGRFVFSEVSPGELALEFAAAGYGSAGGKVMVVEGSSVDIGTVELQPLSATTTVSGRIIDAASADPIAGAVVEAAGAVATTAVDGTYRIEGITALEFKLTASAPGFLSGGGTVVLHEPTLVHADIPLARAQTGGLALTALSTSQPSYPAYSAVPLEAALRNSSELPVVVRLYVKVLDATGALVDEYPAIEVAPGEDPGRANVTIEAADELSATANWYTGNRSPGNYQLLVQAYDAATHNLLAERATAVQVQETRFVESLLLRPAPAYTNIGATESVQFSALVHHRSNVPLVVQISYSLLGPESQVLHTGEADLQVDPGQPYMLAPLGDMTNTFSKAGAYTLNVDAVAGTEPATIEPGRLYVAPGTRLEIQQKASPGTVVPDGNKRIKMQIRLNGVEQR